MQTENEDFIVSHGFSPATVKGITSAVKDIKAQLHIEIARADNAEKQVIALQERVSTLIKEREFLVSSLNGFQELYSLVTPVEIPEEGSYFEPEVHPNPTVVTLTPYSTLPLTVSSKDIFTQDEANAVMQLPYRKIEGLIYNGNFFGKGITPNLTAILAFYIQAKKLGKKFLSLKDVPTLAWDVQVAQAFGGTVPKDLPYIPINKTCTIYIRDEVEAYAQEHSIPLKLTLLKQKYYSELRRAAIDGKSLGSMYFHIFLGFNKAVHWQAAHDLLSEFDPFFKATIEGYEKPATVSISEYLKHNVAFVNDLAMPLPAFLAKYCSFHHKTQKPVFL